MKPMLVWCWQTSTARIPTRKTPPTSWGSSPLRTIPTIFESSFNWCSITIRYSSIFYQHTTEITLPSTLATRRITNYILQIGQKLFSGNVPQNSDLPSLISRPFLRIPGLPSEHSIVGLEAGRRRNLPGRVEAGIHRAELPRARLLHYDGQSLRYEEL